MVAFNLALTVVGAFCLGGITMSKKLEQEKEKLAELGASLTIWLLILVGLLIFTSGVVWSLFKFIMIIMLIYGVRDFYIDYTLLVMSKPKINKLNK